MCLLNTCICLLHGKDWRGIVTYRHSYSEAYHLPCGSPWFVAILSAGDFGVTHDGLLPIKMELPATVLRGLTVAHPAILRV